MEWKKIELEDLKKIKRAIGRKFQTGDLSSINLYMWRKAKKLEYFMDDEVLLIRGVEGDTPFIYPPISDNCMRLREEVLQHIERGYIIRAVPEEIYEILRDIVPLKEERERFDYIYEVDKLISLKGRKYHKKRNHLNKFIRSYDFTYERIDESNIHEVIDFQKNWCEDKECHLDKGLSWEMDGIIELLRNYQDLDAVGGLLRVDGRVAAFTIGEEISPDTVLIHIEKGNILYDGIYQGMNKFFLENEFSSYSYVNREEDLGQENLRRAKESYHPCTLLTKYRSAP